MRKHFAYGVDVSAVGYQQCSVSVPGEVESDRLCKKERIGEDKT